VHEQAKKFIKATTLLLSSHPSLFFIPADIHNKKMSNQNSIPAPPLKKHLGRIRMADGYWVSERPCHYILTYYACCGHVITHFTHRPECVRGEASPSFRVPHCHIYCENVIKKLGDSDCHAFDGSYPLHETGLMHNNHPRICPDSKSKTCQQSVCEAKVVRERCDTCGGGHPGFEIAPGKLCHWLALEMQYKAALHDSYFSIIRERRRKSWYKQFALFMEIYGNHMNGDDRPIAYDPDDRRGFLKDVTEDERSTLQEEEWSCPICAEGLDQGGEVVILPDCKHIFHSECVITWFGYHGPSVRNGATGRSVKEGPTTCPMCRKEWEKLIGVPSWDDPKYVGVNGYAEYRGGFKPFKASDYGFPETEDLELPTNKDTEEDLDELNDADVESIFPPDHHPRSKSPIYGGSVLEIFRRSSTQNSQSFYDPGYSLPPASENPFARGGQPVQALQSSATAGMFSTRLPPFVSRQQIPSSQPISSLGNRSSPNARQEPRRAETSRSNLFSSARRPPPTRPWSGVTPRNPFAQTRLSFSEGHALVEYSRLLEERNGVRNTALAPRQNSGQQEASNRATHPRLRQQNDTQGSTSQNRFTQVINTLPTTPLVHPHARDTILGVRFANGLPSETTVVNEFGVVSERTVTRSNFLSDYRGNFYKAEIMKKPGWNFAGNPATTTTGRFTALNLEYVADYDHTDRFPSTWESDPLFIAFAQRFREETNTTITQGNNGYNGLASQTGLFQSAESAEPLSLSFADQQRNLIPATTPNEQQSLRSDISAVSSWLFAQHSRLSNSPTGSSEDPMDIEDPSGWDYGNVESQR
jgi:hypothetical protein